MWVLPLLVCLAAPVAASITVGDQGSPDSSGTEFIIGFMDKGRTCKHQYVRLFITTASTENVQVQVTSPRASDKSGILVNENFYVTAGEQYTVDVNYEVVATDEGLESKAVLIQSTHEITVYTEYRGHEANDGFLALPTNVLGTEYISVSYYPSRKETEFLIVATEDDTTIAVNIPDNDDVEVRNGKDKYKAKSVMNLKMNKYDTFLAQADKGDLTGAFIKSNKPIAVFSGNIESYVLPKNSYDYLVEQLPPINTWGRKFAFVSTPERTVGDVYRFVASDDTKVTVSCSGGFSSSFDLKARKFNDIDTLKDGACSAESSEPVMVVQFVKSQIDKHENTDPSMIIINPVEQFAPSYTFTTPVGLNIKDEKREYRAFVTVVVKESDKYNLRLDRSELPSSTQFVSIPNTDLVGAYIEVSEGAHTLENKKSTNGIGGYMYGSASKESYGMPIGGNMGNLKDMCWPSKSVPGDGIDNDCDGLVDEELCSDNIDDDGDGSTDEDCSRILTTVVTTTTPVTRTPAVTVPTVITGPSNTGTDFIIGFMDKGRTYKQYPRLFIATSYSTNVQVKVTSPRAIYKNQMMVDETFFVTAGEQHTVNVNVEVVADAAGMNSKGILIKSSHPISVYTEFRGSYANDGFLALPTNVLGTEYISVSYYPSRKETEFLIVATEDDTTIEVSIPDNDNIDVRIGRDRYKANDVMTLQMNRLDTFVGQAYRGDLTGAYIKASKPIAVFSGNVEAYVLPKSSYDYLVEQIPPINTWGKQFAFVSTPERTVGDVYRFVAYKDTKVTVSCSGGFSSSFDLKARKFEDIDTLSEGVCSAKSSEAIMVVQFVKSQIDKHEKTDPSMIIINPIEQFSSSFTFSTPVGLNIKDEKREYRSFVTIIVKESEKDGVRLDRAELPATAKFVSVPNTDLAGASFQVTEGIHTIEHKNSNIKIGGYMYGSADKESYGMPIGTRMDVINAICSPSNSTPGDGIDNDCDGLVDEESCGDNVDNDGDGNTDEDCSIIMTTPVSVATSNGISLPIPTTKLDPADQAPDSIGTKFIIGFMDKGRSCKHQYLRLFVTTGSSQDVKVKVTSPKSSYKNAILIDESFSITFGQMQRVDLDYKIAGKNVELGTKGILIEASHEISVYTEYRGHYSNDGYVALPTDVLGTEYIAVSYYPSRKETEFLIVATEDDTTVEITMPDNDRVELKYGKEKYLFNDVINLKLNQLETFQAQAYRGDLTGAYIKSSKPVSVISGNVESYVLPKKTYDYLVEQIPPINTWGKKFAFVSTPERTVGDVYRFVASKDNTEVKVTCSGGFSASFKLDARKFEDIDTLKNGVCSAEASKAVLLVQFVKSQVEKNEKTDPSMIVINPIEQFSSTYAFTTPVNMDDNRYERRDYRAFVTIVVKESRKKGVRLDGEPLPSSTEFVSIPNTNLAGAYVEVSEGAHVLQHLYPSNTIGGIIYGSASRESYGMPLGGRMSSINTPCTPTLPELGDGIDNDCDGLIDEELCAPYANHIDEDGDGVLSEDCAQIDGKWSAWTAWGDCSVTCAKGIKTRTRVCDDPLPQGVGVYCSGEDTEVTECDAPDDCPSAPDNRGKEFIIAFMENYRSKSDVELFVTTARPHDVKVKVTSPRYFDKSGAMMVNEEFTVKAGYIQTLELDGDIACDGSEMSTKGIHIEAQDEVVVYGTNVEKYSADGFLALPLDVLGTEYYAVVYSPSHDYNEFLVVATEDNTEVRMELPDAKKIEIKLDKEKYEENEVITKTMHKYDTFQAQAKKDGDLTGTHITSNKPIAVFSGNKRAYVLPRRTYDHLVEQLLPVDSWGKTFALVPTPERTKTGDTIRFIGAKQDTKVWVTCNDGMDQRFSVSGRQYEEVDIASETMCYVSATEGIMVVMFVKSEITSREPADPSMIMVPPIGQYGASYAFTTPKNSRKNRVYQNYFTFVVRESAKDGLLLDGMPLPSDTIYKGIPQTNLVGGYVKISDGAHTLVHQSPIQTFGAILYGAARRESYGMVLGLRLANINVPCVRSKMSIGDGINNDCDDFIDEELCGNGIDDDGDGFEDEDCAPAPPVNGNWAPWTLWSDCSVPCGDASDVGERTRSRTCTDPKPSDDGLDCVGSGSESEACSPISPCSVDGNWAQWQEWSPCSVSCESGERSRYRYCEDPVPFGNGADCAGDDNEVAACDTKVECPIHGGFSDWEQWSACSVTCGNGEEVRQRACDNPIPQLGGRDCNGNLTESKPCSVGICEVGIGDPCVNPTATCPDNATCSNNGICECNSGYVYSSSSEKCVESSVNIGDPCVNPTRSCPSSATCTNGICECDRGYVYSSSADVCIDDSAEIDESCTNPTRTCPNNAECSNGLCSCSNGYVYSSSTETCIDSTAKIDESCVNPTRNCPTNAECSNGICQCSNGFVYSSSTETCIDSSAKIDESCVSPTRNCPTNAACSNGICQCNNGFVYSPSTDTCIDSSAKIDESCVNPTRNCPTNAECSNGICQCSNGFVYSSSTETCIDSSANIDESCTNPTRSCPTNAECSNGLCKCSTGYVYSSSTATCIDSSAKIDESCVNPTRNCPANAECSNGICQCSNNYVYSSSTETCVDSSVGVGGPCINPTRSCPANAACKSGVCECDSDFVYSSSTEMCIDSSAGIGESCVNPTRSCPSNASCNSGICECDNGYVYSSVANNCIDVNAKVDESCVSPTRNCPTDAGCSNGVCKCNTGFVYISSSETCVDSSVAVSIGAKCVNPTRTCPSNAACTGGVCECNGGYIYSSTADSCLDVNAKVDEPCVNPVRSCPNNAACINGFCACGSDYVHSPLTETCVSSSANISDSCVNPTRSCPGNAACKNGICECNNGYVYSTSTENCIDSAADIGGECVNPTRSCPGNAACNSGVCECNNGYVYSSSAESCIDSSAGIGESCVNPTRSCPNNGACQNGICECNSGFVYSSSMNACIDSSAKISESCVNPTRSCPSDAACSNGVCGCNNGFVYSSLTETCVDSSAVVSIGAPCVNPTRKCPNNAECSGGVCGCSNGFIYSSLGDACVDVIAQVNESCINPTRSCPSNSACNNGMCECNGGYVYSSTVDACIDINANVSESCVNPARNCPSNAECANGVCECTTGYVYSSSTDACINSNAKVSESCVSPTRPCPNNAACSNGICACNGGFVYSSSTETCVDSSANVGESCVNPTRNCPTNSECSNGICGCVSGYAYSSTTDTCVDKSSVVGIGQSCVNPTRSCSANAACSGGICECSNGYIYASSTESCVSTTAGNGESCINPTRSCGVNAACNGGTCGCISGFIYSSTAGSCVSTTAGNGESCVNPTRSCGANAACNGGTCGCISSYIYSSTAGSCVSTTAGNGESCVNPTRSCGTNAACNGGTCGCKSSFIYSSTAGSCVSTTAGNGESCVNPTRSCGANAACNGGTCGCISSYIYSSTAGSCVSTTAGHGDPCVNPTRSCGVNAACNGGTCGCISGFIYSSTAGSCVSTTAGNGESCVNPTRSCGANAACNGGTCGCISSYIYSSTAGSCVSTTAGNGESCVNPTRSCGANAACNGGTCGCISSYIYSSTAGSCVSTTAGNGESCVNPTRSCGANAACNGGTCGCISSYIYSSTAGSCVSTTAGNGESCVNPTRSCGANAACNGGTCGCISSYIYSSTAGSCVSTTAGNGDPCVNPTRSCGVNAACNGGTCSCDSSFIYSSTAGSCVSTTAGNGESCVNPTRSCGTNAACNNGTCQCNNSYIYSSTDSSCVSTTAGNGDPCVNPTRSCGVNAACSGGTCGCKTGYIYSSTDGSCVSTSAGNGESCVNPTRSCGANAACSNGVCGCNNGYTYSSSSGSCESTSSVPDVDGNWSDWASWIPCTKTCGSGITMRTRLCDNPQPSGNGKFCEGVSFEAGPCNTDNCPSPYGGQAAAYVNRCPSGFFTCRSGGISCIQEEFCCDCMADCEDGSDESDSWSFCTADMLKTCENSASGLGAWSGVVLLLLAGHLLTWILRNFN